MPWLIGVDEAGYGPNLGPFVMTLVACRVPDALADADLWDVLKSCVRRANDPVDGRVVVADSKQVYSSASGWDQLERTVLSTCSSPSLAAMLENLCHDKLPTLRQEAWFVGDTVLPTIIAPGAHADCCRRWQSASENAGITWGFIQSAIVPTPSFNDLIEKWDSKSAVLSVALTRLLQHSLAATNPGPMRIVIDKHGGRNNYSALLQHAFADGMVLAEEEGRMCSRYRVEGLDRPVSVTFMPKADFGHFPVALASMISKYVRELLMREFNRFWQSHVPGLVPTAGYPNDAVRYFDAIRPAMAKLGMAERLVWRCR
jgi:ribonuclease HII